MNPPHDAQQFPHPQTTRGRRTLKIGVGLFAAVSVGFLVSRWVLVEDLTAAADFTALPVETIEAQPVDRIQAKRVFTGRIASQRATDLAFVTSARVTAVLVDEGDRVRQGQPLARLDDRDLKLQRASLAAQRDAAQARLDELREGPRRESIEAARAQVSEIERQLELAQVQTRRRSELLARQAISQEEFDRLDFQAKALDASLEAARARLRELETGTRSEQIRAQEAVVAELSARIESVELEVDKSILRAPFAGRIAARSLDEGAVSSPGLTVLRLVEESEPEARIGVPVESVGQLAVGDVRSVEVAGREYEARVTSVLPELEARTRTATVLLALPRDSGAELFPGQIARLSLDGEEAVSGYWLPLSALTRGARGLWAAYAVEPAGEGAPEPGLYQVERRQVEILHSEGDRALVRGALAPGVRLIAAGANRVADGQLVRPVGD